MTLCDTKQKRTCTYDSDETRLSVSKFVPNNKELVCVNGYFVNLFKNTN